MEKIEKENIKAAILIYTDPDTNQGRRVVCGEAGALVDLFILQLPEVWRTLNKILGKTFKTPDEMIEYYKKEKEEYVKLHNIKASEQLRLDLTYRVKKG